jgi:hypothetical protein
VKKKYIDLDPDVELSGRTILKMGFQETDYESHSESKLSNMLNGRLVVTGGSNLKS